MKRFSGNIWSADRVQWTALAFLLAFSFLFGGGARHDIISLIILRPLSVLLAAYGFYAFMTTDSSRYTTPLVCLFVLLGYMLLQLMPLPPLIWKNLPERDIIAHIDQLRGKSDAWRPVTLTLSRTINSVNALFVPIAVLLLVSVIKHKYFEHLILFILCCGIISAAVAILQVLGPIDGPLYFYRITNNGLPVGLFANRNHHAVFLASQVPLLLYAIHFNNRWQLGRLPRLMISLLAVTFLVVLTFMTGSRAGSALMAGVIGALLLFAALRYRSRAVLRKARSSRFDALSRKLALPIAVVLAMLVIALTQQLSQTEAIVRLNEQDANAELRFRTLPYVVDMAWSYLPLGSGFGSFEFVYKIIEPDALLSTSFFNQAHNDLLQIIIEGGVPAIIILVVFLRWFVHRLVVVAQALWRGQNGQAVAPDTWLLAALVLAMLVILLGSIADYPLRTPLVMAYFAALTGVATRIKQS